jgi:hypothetical protein
MGGKLFGLLRRPQAGLQLSGSVVVEAEVRCRKTLFENCHSGEQAHRSALDLVGRGEKHFSVALKKCSGDSAQHILGKGDGAVFQSDMDRGPVQRRPPHFEHPRGIQSDTTQ